MIENLEELEVDEELRENQSLKVGEKVLISTRFAFLSEPAIINAIDGDIITVTAEISGTLRMQRSDIHKCI